MGNLINIVGGPLIAASSLRFTDEGIRLWLWIMMMRPLNSLGNRTSRAKKKHTSESFHYQDRLADISVGHDAGGGALFMSERTTLETSPKNKKAQASASGGRTVMNRDRKREPHDFERLIMFVV